MNKSTIQSFLASNNHAIEVAMVGLLARQTVGEQNTSTTIESNGRGFNYTDAEYGTYLAKWVKSGRHLTGRHLVAARRMTCFYWRQVSEMSSVLRLFPLPPTVVINVDGDTMMSDMLGTFCPFIRHDDGGHWQDVMDNRASL